MHSLLFFVPPLSSYIPRGQAEAGLCLCFSGSEIFLTSSAFFRIQIGTRKREFHGRSLARKQRRGERWKGGWIRYRWRGSNAPAEENTKEFQARKHRYAKAAEFPVARGQHFHAHARYASRNQRQGATEIAFAFVLVVLFVLFVRFLCYGEILLESTKVEQQRQSSCYRGNRKSSGTCGTAAKLQQLEQSERCEAGTDNGDAR